MSGFDDRERAFEEKFSHEQELEFKAAARRDTLLGQWAAEQLGMSDAETEAYARSVFEVDMERKGPDAVRDKVFSDLQAGSIDISEYLVEKKMVELLEVAREEIKNGTNQILIILIIVKRGFDLGSPFFMLYQIS